MRAEYHHEGFRDFIIPKGIERTCHVNRTLRHDSTRRPFPSLLIECLSSNVHIEVTWEKSREKESMAYQSIIGRHRSILWNAYTSMLLPPFDRLPCNCHHRSSTSCLRLVTNHMSVINEKRNVRNVSQQADHRCNAVLWYRLINSKLDWSHTSDEFTLRQLKHNWQRHVAQ